MRPDKDNTMTRYPVILSGGCGSRLWPLSREHYPKPLLPLTRDLIPVAAQLSAAHMHWWIAISDAMRQLSQAVEREQLERSGITQAGSGGMR